MWSLVNNLIAYLTIEIFAVVVGFIVVELAIRFYRRKGWELEKQHMFRELLSNDQKKMSGHQNWILRSFAIVVFVGIVGVFPCTSLFEMSTWAFTSIAGLLFLLWAANLFNDEMADFNAYSLNLQETLRDIDIKIGWLEQRKQRIIDSF